MGFKKIVCFDFDGVIHSYTSGWKGATEIPDPPVDGAIWTLSDMVMKGLYDIHIYSSRSRYEGAIEAMRGWFIRFGMKPHILSKLTFSREKPPAFVTIDDRAICFNGDFSSIQDQIAKFRPWNK